MSEKIHAELYREKAAKIIQGEEKVWIWKHFLWQCKCSSVVRIKLWNCTPKNRDIFFSCTAFWALRLKSCFSLCMNRREEKKSWNKNRFYCNFTIPDVGVIRASSLTVSSLLKPCALTVLGPVGLLMFLWFKMCSWKLLSFFLFVFFSLPF